MIKCVVCGTHGTCLCDACQHMLSGPVAKEVSRLKGRDHLTPAAARNFAWRMAYLFADTARKLREARENGIL